MDDMIINKNGQLSTVTGKGVDAFRLKALYLSLEFRQQTGFDMDRRFNSLKYAQKETGLKTNDLQKLKVAVIEKMNKVIAECEIVEQK